MAPNGLWEITRKFTLVGVFTENRTDNLPNTIRSLWPSPTSSYYVRSAWRSCPNTRKAINVVVCSIMVQYRLI